MTSSKTEYAWRKCVLIFYSALKKMSSISITSINHRKKLSESNSFSDKAFIPKPAEGEIGSCIRKRQVSRGSEPHGEPSMCTVLIRTLGSLHFPAQGLLDSTRIKLRLCGQVNFGVEIATKGVLNF